MNRRNVLRWLSAGVGAGSTDLLQVGSLTSLNYHQPQVDLTSSRGLPPLKITDVKVILTAPNGVRLVVVKVLTNEPGLYGLGCATFTQRAYVVQTAIEQYLKPFLMGRNPDEIEDIWQSSYVSSYWRNGPILFNAMSGVDMALWDIKGKRANMPVYQLLGGKCRFAADVYYHVRGRDFEEIEDASRRAMEEGYRYLRIPGDLAGYGSGGVLDSSKQGGVVGPTNPIATWDSAPYVRMLPKLFEYLRLKLGDDVQLLHDVHERVTLSQAISLCKELERYRLFFLEDPFPPEENEHFRLLRQQSAIPLAMGELFNNQHEYLPLISNRLIDYIRIHISQIGGLSMARKVAALSEFFGVKTAWHGPGDCSPVGHAAGLALELASYNFGIHEGYVFPTETQEVFPGCPTTKKGYIYANEAPGFGIDVDERLAAKFPYPSGNSFDYTWGTTRRRDGTVIRP